MQAKKTVSNFVRRPLHQHTENLDLQRAIDRADQQADASGMNMNVVSVVVDLEPPIDGGLRIYSDFQLNARISAPKREKFTTLYTTDKGYAVPSK